jgi:hypothetical protein
MCAALGTVDRLEPDWSSLTHRSFVPTAWVGIARHPLCVGSCLQMRVAATLFAPDQTFNLSSDETLGVIR